MARARVTDRLQGFRFWLLDVSPSEKAPFEVLNPLAGFSAITMPEITLEAETVNQYNSMWPRSVYSGGSVGAITLSRGATLWDSSFYGWIKRGFTGSDRVHRNLLLVQYSGIAVNTGLSSIGPVGSWLDDAVVRKLASMPAKAWMLWECLPVRYKAGGDLDATSNEVSIQELEVQPAMVEELSLA